MGSSPIFRIFYLRNLHLETDAGFTTSAAYIERETSRLVSADFGFGQADKQVADYIIDMGPEGGKGGGELLSCGTPEEVAMSTKGYTPKFLKEELHL